MPSARRCRTNRASSPPATNLRTSTPNTRPTRRRARLTLTPSPTARSPSPPATRTENGVSAHRQPARCSRSQNRRPEQGNNTPTRRAARKKPAGAGDVLRAPDRNRPPRCRLVGFRATLNWRFCRSGWGCRTAITPNASVSAPRSLVGFRADCDLPQRQQPDGSERLSHRPDPNEEVTEASSSRVLVAPWPSGVMATRA